MLPSVLAIDYCRIEMQGQNGDCALAATPSYMQNPHHISSKQRRSSFGEVSIELKPQNRPDVRSINNYITSPADVLNAQMHGSASSSEIFNLNSNRIPLQPVSHQPIPLTNGMSLNTNGVNSGISSASVSLNTMANTTTSIDKGPTTTVNGSSHPTTTTQLMNHSTSLPVAMNSCMLRNRYVFIQRDYSNGVGVRFETKFPAQLDGRIEREQFVHLVTVLNQMFEKAESISPRSLFYNCLSCLTAYLAIGCINDQYGQMMIKVRRFVKQQNLLVFQPRGLKVGDPLERGLRVLEIQIDNPDYD